MSGHHENMTVVLSALVLLITGLAWVVIREVRYDLKERKRSSASQKTVSEKP